MKLCVKFATTKLLPPPLKQTEEDRLTSNATRLKNISTMHNTVARVIFLMQYRGLCFDTLDDDLDLIAADPASEKYDDEPTEDESSSVSPPPP